MPRPGRPAFQKPPDDIPMDRETLLKHLGVSPSKSAFYEWVQKGKVIKVPGPKNLYLLNQTRQRFGMEPLDVGPLRKDRARQPTNADDSADPPEATERQILFMVFSALLPDFLEFYPWDIWPESFSEREWGTVDALYNLHKKAVYRLETDDAKVLYALKVMKDVELAELAPA